MLIPENTYINLYHDQRNQHLVRYERNKKFLTGYGVVLFPPDLKYGTPLKSESGYTFYALKPDTSRVSKKLKRQTTIVYPKDAGLILLELGIHSGSHVAEVGSGSGAMTLILSNMVGNEGRVYSYERREEFLNLARNNHTKYGLFDNVEFTLRDIAQEGFIDNAVDAVFIDVPEPWNIIHHAYKILNGGHPAGILSPNIEQIQESHRVMEETGFLRLRTFEIIKREIMVRRGKTRPRERAIIHTGYLLFGDKIEKIETETSNE